MSTLTQHETIRSIEGPIGPSGIERIESPVEIDGETFLVTDSFYFGRYDFTFATKLVDDVRWTISYADEVRILEGLGLVVD